MLVGEFVEKEADDALAFLKALAEVDGNTRLRGPPLASALVCLCASRSAARADGAAKGKAAEWFAKFVDALSTFVQLFGDKPCCADDIEKLVDGVACSGMGETKGEGASDGEASESRREAVRAVLDKLWGANVFTAGKDRQPAAVAGDAGNGAVAEAAALASAKDVKKRLARLYTAGATLRALGTGLGDVDSSGAIACAAIILRERVAGLDLLEREGGAGQECAPADDLLLLACGCLRRAVEPADASSLSAEGETSARVAAVLRSILCETGLARDSEGKGSEGGTSSCVFSLFCLLSTARSHHHRKQFMQARAGSTFTSSLSSWGHWTSSAPTTVPPQCTRAYKSRTYSAIL